MIETDGTQYVLEVYSLDDHALGGKTTGGPDVEGQMDDIALMKTESVSVIPTLSLAPLLAVTAIGSLVLLLLIPS